MVLFPIFVNSLQFWITDNIIKNENPKEPKEDNSRLSKFATEEDSKNHNNHSLLHEMEENLNRTFNFNKH